MKNIANIKLVLQNDTTCAHLPSKKQFQQWLTIVAHAENISSEVTLRLVDTKEIQQLNHQFRHKNKPTNVLSFPYEPFPGEVASAQLGDLVLCPSIVIEEAKAQHKTELAHWAHLTIHGLLHLLGYDHEMDSEAAVMESKEIAFLQQLGYANPYE